MQMETVLGPPRRGATGAAARLRPAARSVQRRLGLSDVPAPVPVSYTRPLVAYVATVVGAAAVTGVLTVRAVDDPRGLAAAAAMIAVLSALGVRSISGLHSTFSVSSFLQLGIAVTMGPSGALLGAASEAAANGLRFRAGWFRAVFNVSNIFLANVAAWAAFRIPSHLAAGVGTIALTAAAGLLAGLAHHAVNHVLVAGVVSVSAYRGLVPQLRSSMATLPYSLSYGYAAAGFAALYDRYGAFGFTFALAPVLGLQIFMLVFAERMRVHERQRTALLDKLTEQAAAVETSYDATLIALTNALDARDKETEGHSRRVVEYTRVIAVELGIGGEDLKVLCHGALLHDIGKIGVPDAILHKPGKLDEAEWEVMRRHVLLGAHMVEEVPHLSEARRIILEHHERWDGQGYPRGLRRMEICLGARAFAVADAVDAITQDRPYRRAMSFDQAREELLRYRGVQFDPEAVDAFLRLPHDELDRILSMRSGVGLDLLSAQRFAEAEARRALRR